MRFFHIADVHLGASPDAGFPWSEERKNEIWDSFCNVIYAVREEKPELLLIAGDLFHRQPLLRELKEVDYLFSTIPQTTVVMIAGNHDYIRRDSYYLKYPWSKNVIGLWKDQVEAVYVPQADAWVYGRSYHSRELPDESICKTGALQKPGCHILLAHGGDERHMPIQTEQLAAGGFDYVALGHIHRPQTVIRNMAVFAGALEPIDRNDIGRHGYIRGNYRDGMVSLEFVPSAMRSYIPLTVTVTPDTAQFSLEEQISAQIAEEGSDNIFKIELHGFRDAQMNIDLHRIRELGNVIDVTDETQPDYDFDLLEEQYEGSLIAAYIRHFKCCEEPIERKALYYGLQALLASQKDM